MRRLTIGDSINRNCQPLRGWLSCLAILGIVSYSGCDVNVEDEPDGGVDVIDVDDDPDVEVDAPGTSVDVDPD